MTNVSPFPTAPMERQRIAAAIRAHLAVANLSDTKAGALIGLSQSAMSRRTNAQHPFDIDELSSLSKALGKSIYEIIVMPTQQLPDLDSNQEPIGSPLHEIVNLHDYLEKKTAIHNTHDGNGEVG